MSLVTLGLSGSNVDFMYELIQFQIGDKLQPWERSREIQYFSPEMYIYYKNNLKLHEQDDEHLNDTQIQQRGLYNSVLNKEGSSN